MLRRFVTSEGIEGSEHRHPVARTVPLRPGVAGQLVVDGRATAADGDLLDLLDTLGLPVEPEESRLPSGALTELRASER